MWILPSRGRPQNVLRLSRAFVDTDATTPVWLRLDRDDPTAHQVVYDSPWIWSKYVGERVPLSEVYNEAFQLFPRADWYGFIADDVVPETPGWDQKLIDVAGPDGMAVPSGAQHEGITPHFVLGGDLVRSVGWLALPGLDRIYIDTVWADIARRRDVLRFVPEVVLAHHHFSNQKALYDKTYRKHHKAEDRAVYDAWRATVA